MPRSIVYEGGTGINAGIVKDGYLEKLVKYVPAEVLAFYLPAFALFDDDGGRWIVFVIAALGTLMYAGIRARMEQTGPKWWTFVLALVAFFAWAVGASAFGTDLLGLTVQWATLVVLTAILFIPGIDELLSPK